MSAGYLIEIQGGIMAAAAQEEGDEGQGARPQPAATGESDT